MLNCEIEQFINYCRISNFAAASIETLTLRLKEFKIFLQGTSVSSIKDINYKHLKEFVTKFQTISVHVRKARIWTLHQFFHFLELNNLIDNNIALEIPYPKIEKTVPKFLTVDEFNQILLYFYQQSNTELGLRNLTIIMILGLLGLRLSSIISLNINDIDLTAELMWISEKGGKHRTMIIPKVLCIVFSSYLESLNKIDGPLFLSKRNKRISVRSLQNIFKQTVDHLGIDKHLHAHLFRHTAATHMAKVTDFTITQHVLGHSCRKNTEKYTHLNSDQYAVYMKKHPFMKIGKE